MAAMTSSLATKCCYLVSKHETVGSKVCVDTRDRQQIGVGGA